MEEYEEHRGKGSFPAMITPAYQNAKKANELASDVSTSSGRPTGRFLRAEPEENVSPQFLSKFPTSASFVQTLRSQLSASKETDTNSGTPFRSAEAGADAGLAR